MISIRSFFIFTSILFCSFSALSQTEKVAVDTNNVIALRDFKKSRKFKKLFLKEFEDFRRIPKSKMWVEFGSMMKFTENDFHALAGSRESTNRITSSEFFINMHEVTTEEYRAFLDTYKLPMIENGTYDTLVQDHPVWYTSSDPNGMFGSLNIQAESRLWIDEMATHMLDPMMEYYFSYPAFNNYPIVALTYEQCLAFVEWKNEQFSIKLKAMGFDQPWGSYRMPTRDEWAIAAGSLLGNQWLDENRTHSRLYPWDGHSLRDWKDGTFMSNFGAIIDDNGLGIKNLYDDGFMYTAPVKSYKPNDFGLYDMAGNVSEWTSTNIDYDSLYKDYKAYYDLACFNGDTIFYREINKRYPDWVIIDSLAEVGKSNNAIWINPKYRGESRSLSEFVHYAKMYKPMETHNLELLEKYKEQNIVKGGNWWLGPVYMLLSSEQVYYRKEASVTLGMRLALDLNPEVLTFLGEDFDVYLNRKVKK